MRAAHERHREALAELEAGVHLPVVVRAASELGVEVRHPPHVLRSALRAGPGPYAEMLLALGPRVRDVVRVECSVRRPEGAGAPYLARVGSVGWVSVAPITDDPVARTAAGLEGRNTTLVRYHRGSRVTVRVIRPAAADSCPVAYAKVFSDDRGAAYHDLGVALADLARSGRLDIRVAGPMRYDDTRRVLWQGEVAGVPAAGLLTGPQGAALAARMGAALGSLHRCGPDSALRLTFAGTLLRTERHAAEAARLVPALGERIMRLLDSVGTGPTAAPGVPLHGSPDPTQWVLGDDPVPGLVDFDRFAWGEAEHDLACFLVEAEARVRGPDAGAVLDEFVAGYHRVADPVDPEVLRRHCTMRRVGKVLRAARSLRADGDRKAERILAAAERAARADRATSGAG